MTDTRHNARDLSGGEVERVMAERARTHRLLGNLAQLLDAWKAGDPDHWTEWDQGLRDEITSLLMHSARTPIQPNAVSVETGGQNSTSVEGTDVVQRLVEALTPSAETKAAYHGEFHFSLTRVDEAGDECAERVYVPWDTTKQIMKAILARSETLSSIRGNHD